MKPRLVKSQREMEGRFEDVWVLVDEDDEVETWSAEADLAVVGKPATRQERSSARRRTTSTTRPRTIAAAMIVLML